MISDTILKKLNGLFPKQRHPFNLQNAGEQNYVEWEFEKGADAVRHYLGKYTTDDLFRGKTVLDMGCGAGGKSVYYLSLGAARVVGADIVESYQSESVAFAKSKGYGPDRFTFILGDAGHLDIPDGTFDTVILNDFFEHASDPERVLAEAIRMLKPGGAVYVNFPPYWHPFGAHLSDAINMPWVHVFFGDQTLIRVYKDLVKDLPDGKMRLGFRISKDENGREYFSYINKMTVSRFLSILKKEHISPEYLDYTPLRSCFRPLTHIPGVREFFIKNVTFVIRKP